MYLSDREINPLLQEMRTTHDNGKLPFDPGVQVQPCSIDLRLSNVFWKPSRTRNLWRRLGRRPSVVDLRHSQAHDLDPLRDWKRCELGEGDTITIKPKSVVMGRVYERFKMPPGYAGKIEGRSSFARLGLAVHCTGDFINPGWEGFMPLQLFNAGPYPIRITPHLSVCQLMIVPLSSEPERSYGDAELANKYANDEGGPSMWWRDYNVKAIQKHLGEVHATERLQNEIVEEVRFEDVEVLERFQRFLGKRRIEDVENKERLLRDFSAVENRRRTFDTASLAAIPILLAADLGSLLVPFGIGHVVLYALTLLSIPLGLRSWVRRESGYLGKKELRVAEGVRASVKDGPRGS